MRSVFDVPKFEPGLACSTRASASAAKVSVWVPGVSGANTRVVRGADAGMVERPRARLPVGPRREPVGDVRERLLRRRRQRVAGADDDLLGDRRRDRRVVQDQRRAGGSRCQRQVRDLRVEAHRVGVRLAARVGRGQPDLDVRRLRVVGRGHRAGRPVVEGAEPVLVTVAGRCAVDQRDAPVERRGRQRAVLLVGRRAGEGDRVAGLPRRARRWACRSTRPARS